MNRSIGSASLMSRVQNFYSTKFNCFSKNEFKKYIFSLGKSHNLIFFKLLFKGLSIKRLCIALDFVFKDLFVFGVEKFYSRKSKKRSIGKILPHLYPHFTHLFIVTLLTANRRLTLFPYFNFSSNWSLFSKLFFEAVEIFSLLKFS